ncbi:MAG TPA: SDR family oxidoreductase [Verrucomicrobiae bacterium]|jgi:NAD(P)-dependent dehydrogenase (short-subunit alcohol dehydrogenase family)|nr:SDR family oxidoreductase [Verrucomicrobiae bacterium]
MNRLQNKRALITGGTSGIGLETARAFVREGARVAITARDAGSLEAARKELGNEVLPIPSDMGEIAAQKKVAETIRQVFGKLDVLFLNAGIAEMRPLENWDESGFDRSFNINFKGPFFLLQALLPVFNNPASVVLMTSINSHIGMPNSSIYGATKSALLSLSRTLSGELISRGIRVNAVTGGPIATPLYRKLGMGDKEIKGLQEQIPAGRMGTPLEVAQAVVYFASDESAFTVGSELVIDGGMSNL